MPLAQYLHIHHKHYNDVQTLTSNYFGLWSMFYILAKDRFIHQSVPIVFNLIKHF